MQGKNRKKKVPTPQQVVTTFQQGESLAVERSNF